MTSALAETPIPLHDSRPPLTDPSRKRSLDDALGAFLGQARSTETDSLETTGELPPLKDWVELAEAWRISVALRQCRGNRSAAARSLGIGRRTLYSKLEKLGLAGPPASADAHLGATEG